LTFKSGDPTRRARVSKRSSQMADVQNNGVGGAASDAARSAADAASRQIKDGARAVQGVADKAAEGGRAATEANGDILRNHLDTAQQAVRSSLETGARSFEGLTQTLTRTFGVAPPNPDLAERAAQNVQAISQASSALAKGAQDASRAWLDLTQKTVRTNLEAIGQLSACRTIQELAAVHSNLVRDNLQQAIESGDVIARVSSDAIREANRAIQTSAQPAPAPRAV